MQESLLSAAVRHGAAGGGWREVTATGGPSPRSDVQVVTYGRNIYIHGGFITAAGAETGELWRFNLDTAVWTQLATSPGAVRLHRTVAVNKKIYTFGGYDGSAYVDIVRSYDIAANTWAVIASPPSGVIGSANIQVVSVETAIYLLGGAGGNFINGSAGFLKLETYPSPVWSTLTSHPVPISNGTLAVYDDMIYSGHGTYNNGATINNKIRSYDIYNNAAGWVEEATIPTVNASARNLGTVVTKGEEIWYMGGTGQTDIIEAYNARTKTYIPDTGFKMTPNKQSSRGWTAGNKQYIFDTDGKVWEFDNRRGMPKAPFVLVPHQEFITGVDYVNIGTALNIGSNWCLIRPTDGTTWMYPQKFLRSGVRAMDYPYWGVNFNGQNWSWISPGVSTNPNDPWDNINASLLINRTPGNPVYPKVANYRNLTMWGSVFRQVWTNVDKGNDQGARGGTDYAGSSDVNKYSGIGAKPILQLSSGTIPW